jgi:hypothetical protein
MPTDKPATDLTPPTKAKKAAAAKAPAEPTGSTVLPKAGEGVPSVDGNVPAKKPRAPRTDYGYSPEAVIAVVEGKDHGYRGQRLEWFNRVKEFNGKTAGEFLKANDNRTTPKGSEDPPRGWLRFFVQDGSVTLSGGKPAAATPASAGAAPSVSEPQKGDKAAEQKAA